MPLENRATIGNMSPEYGSTVTIFPIDDETLRYLRFTGRPEERVALVEAYAKAQGLWHDPARRARVLRAPIELDLATVEPSIAGPTRPQDRVALRDARRGLARRCFPAAACLRPRRRRTSPTCTGHRRAPQPSRSRPATRRPQVGPGPHASSGRRRPPTATTTATRISEPTEVVLADGTACEIDHGHVVIAAITSCTNTSNPAVMIAAGCWHERAVERGLDVKPWVKTSLAPGSRVVMDYYERAGLLPYLEALGLPPRRIRVHHLHRQLGPRRSRVSAAADRLALVSVLSGNRNFEGRINPDVRMNYLASPPLVVAYALAGTMDIDLTTDPLGTDADGAAGATSPTSGRRAAEVQQTIRDAIRSDMFTDALRLGLRRRRPLEQPRRSPPDTATSGTTPPPTSTGPRSSTA